MTNLLNCHDSKFRIPYKKCNLFQWLTRDLWTFGNTWVHHEIWNCFQFLMFGFWTVVRLSLLILFVLDVVCLSLTNDSWFNDTTKWSRIKNINVKSVKKTRKQSPNIWAETNHRPHIKAAKKSRNIGSTVPFNSYVYILCTCSAKSMSHYTCLTLIIEPNVCVVLILVCLLQAIFKNATDVLN